MTSKRLVVVLFVLWGCEKSSPREFLETAQMALQNKAFADAVAAADRGLNLTPLEPSLRWRLELVRLEAQARAGHAQDAAATLERLAGANRSPIKPSHYLSTADQLRSAGDGAGAANLLDRAARRYPNDATIQTAIERAKTEGTDSEIERLRSLGYVD